jgi:hypothetical protein
MAQMMTNEASVVSAKHFNAAAIDCLCSNGRIQNIGSPITPMGFGSYFPGLAPEHLFLSHEPREAILGS